MGYIILLLVLAAAGWGIKSRLGSPAIEDPGESSTILQTPATDPDTGRTGIEIHPAGWDELTHDDTQTQQPAPPVVPRATSAEAAALYARGCARDDAGELVEARKLLSEALASGALTVADAAGCRRRLNAVAATLVFSREIHPGDPYSRQYRVKSGQYLSRIVKDEKLYVPHEGIMRINEIADATKIQANQRIKLLQGPFDAIITKHAYTLDLYHHGMFVKSFRIGLGQDGSTPTGRWRVRDRVPRARWTPPPGSNGSRTLEWNEPGYPLGKEGYWIALDGMDRANEMVSGFGIHGTNEPESIGKQASLGCIRLADDDIAFVYDFLYPGKSTVEVRP